MKACSSEEQVTSSLQERVRCDFTAINILLRVKETQAHLSPISVLQDSHCWETERSGFVKSVQEISSAWPGLHRPWAAQARPQVPEKACSPVGLCLVFCFSSSQGAFIHLSLIIQIMATCCLPFHSDHTHLNSRSTSSTLET